MFERMKTVLLLLLLLWSTGCGDKEMVYVCDSGNAVRYHLKEHCRGLSNCTYRILKLSLDEARQQGKSLCKWER